jgi:hypothetical protein
MKSLKLYTETDYPRKLNISITQIGGGKHSLFNQAMVRRGVYKTSTFKVRDYGPDFTEYSDDLSPIIQISEEKIHLNVNRKYTVKNLSLLSLIESSLAELFTESLKIDLLKIEIMLQLFKGEDMFYNKGVLFMEFFEAESIYEACEFFADLQIYLYNVAKMLVSEYTHDFFIDKELNNELTLSKTDSYDGKYSYFGDSKFYFLDESIYSSFRSIFKEELDLVQ